MTKSDCASKPSVREIVVKFSRGKWFQFTTGGSIKAAKHKLISFRSWPWWMITKPNKHITNRKHTYLFYGKVNCTCNAEVSDSVRFSNAKWGVDPAYQPCDLRVIVVSTIPDDALLRKLRVLLRTKFWIFFPINKNSVLSRQHSPAINWFNKLVLAR